MSKSDYISIIITSYKRSRYLRRAIESVYKYADYPFELIVHDDGSDPTMNSTLRDLKEKCSVLIESGPPNVGLSRAINRCVSVASSDYILFLGDDCWLDAPCFQDIVRALSRPYIGWVCPGDNRLINTAVGKYKTELTAETMDSSETFGLTNNLLGAYTLGFRKAVWTEIGGWDELISSGRCDNVFVTRLIESGYWKAILNGPSRVELANNDRDYIPTGPLQEADRPVGRLFNIDKASGLKIQQERDLDKNKREAMCLLPGGAADLHYWLSYYFAIFRKTFGSIFNQGEIVYNPREIDWKIAEKHGQAAWRNEIFKDFNLN